MDGERCETKIFMSNLENRNSGAGGDQGCWFLFSEEQPWRPVDVSKEHELMLDGDSSQLFLTCGFWYLELFSNAEWHSIFSYVSMSPSTLQVSVQQTICQ